MDMSRIDVRYCQESGPLTVYIYHLYRKRWLQVIHKLALLKMEIFLYLLAPLSSHLCLLPKALAAYRHTHENGNLTHGGKRWTT